MTAIVNSTDVQNCIKMGRGIFRIVAPVEVYDDTHVFTEHGAETGIRLESAEEFFVLSDLKENLCSGDYDRIIEHLVIFFINENNIVS